MSTLSEQEFRIKSDEAIDQAERTLLPLADSEGFEIEIQDGVLELSFEEPQKTKFVVSPNAPARQVWVSAMAKGYKLSWSPHAGTFELGGETLPQLLERLTREFTGAS
jgi:CyaY protein